MRLTLAEVHVGDIVYCLPAQEDGPTFGCPRPCPGHRVLGLLPEEQVIAEEFRNDAGIRQWHEDAIAVQVREGYRQSRFVYRFERRGPPLPPGVQAARHTEREVTP